MNIRRSLEARATQLGDLHRDLWEGVTGATVICPALRTAPRIDSPDQLKPPIFRMSPNHPRYTLSRL